MTSYLVTGASRGIGLGLVQSLVKDPENLVIATARNPSASEGLQELSKQYDNSNRLVLLRFDVSNFDDIDKVAQEVDQLLPNGLDYLVNNAGISRQLLVTYDDLYMILFFSLLVKQWLTLILLSNYDHLTEELRLNTVCMIKLLGAFKPIISRSTEKKIVTMSSFLASIELSVTCPLIGRSYGIAKAALNMTTRKWIIGNRDSGITGVLIHPGVVRTDMGTPLAEFFKAIGYNGDVLTVDESVHYIRKIVDDPSRFSESVRFCSYKGPDLPF
ncbi:hypothetical protein C8Q75DRAFT_818563 [Abortiporus biennis]|nr:hypothetical protein C8Q75DRAFT_818563 [Abortiporus biennis]